MGRLISSGHTRAPGCCPKEACIGSLGLRATTPEHPGGYPEEEEERGGSLGLGVTAQGYGWLAGGGGMQ